MSMFNFIRRQRPVETDVGRELLIQCIECITTDLVHIRIESNGMMTVGPSDKEPIDE